MAYFQLPPCFSLSDENNNTQIHRGWSWEEGNEVAPEHKGSCSRGRGSLAT